MTWPLRRTRASALAIAAIAYLALAGLGQAADSNAPTPEQSRQAMEKHGWRFVALSDDTLVYMKDTAASGAVRQVWTAYDSLKKRDRGGFAFMSVESLGEYNCAEDRSRVLRETFYEFAGTDRQNLGDAEFRADPVGRAGAGLGRRDKGVLRLQG